jgi:type II secretory ATPase GspE/PulE/Tfp pilus assembly ATPase PilB-like protein
MFNKKKNQNDGKKTSRGELVRSENMSENVLTHNKVSDPTTQESHQVIGNVVTGPGGDLEITSEMRIFIVATSGQQIFYSRSEKDNPKVQSMVSELRMRMQNPGLKVIAVDGSTISEINRVAGINEIAFVQKKTTDVSRMQRELLGIVGNAARANASDIHVVVNQEKALIIFRIDGVMRETAETQPSHAFEMLQAAFAMADESDASYQMKSYQGARISSLQTNLPEGVQSLRLQFNPLANNGRYLIMRLLYSGDGKATGLEKLGYNAKQVNQIKTMTARPVGINIVSGPTGSGKSTTLKAVLEGMIERRNGEINTICIEDPPEYIIKGAQQMPVTNAKTQEERSAAFIAAISAALRSDPDVLMIGEIRDLASANLAVEGALSGHPIYASLHANTAMDILSRLRDMGVEDFKVFDHTVFSGLIGQRLVRKLCTHCRIKYDDALLENKIDTLFNDRINNMLNHTPDNLKSQQLYVANIEGCPNCSKGYLGRSVISEIILPDEEFMALMAANKKGEARNYWFEKLNGIDLLGAAWIRALQGFVSPEDIEHTVALIEPISAHEKALTNWANV